MKTLQRGEMSSNGMFYGLVLIVVWTLLGVCHGVLDKVTIVPGDVNMGGLFPLHTAGQDGDCTELKKGKGIQRMEAMLYAIQEINKSDKILKGIKVGAQILDTCEDYSHALEQSLKFAGSLLRLDSRDVKCDDGRPAVLPKPKPLLGVIGAASSSVSIMVANILRLFQIPQISYASTSEELSDKTRFQYFSRVVPSDSYQSQAMVDIVKSLGWTYVSTVASEGNYGEKGVEAFRRLATSEGICIATEEKISRRSAAPEFLRVVMKLQEKSNARGVVLFANEDDLQGILSAARNLSANFSWVGSDAWGSKAAPVQNHKDEAEGAITILLKKVDIPGFDKYFTSLNPKNNNRNAWFTEFWEETFYCKYNMMDARDGVRQCSGREMLGRDESRGSRYLQEDKVQFVIDAVYALAIAFDRMHKEICGPAFATKICSELRDIDGELLLSYIRNVSFHGASGDLIYFDDNGDAPGRYDIVQFQKLNGSFDYVPVGDWNGTLRLTGTWSFPGVQRGQVPQSVCSQPCGPAEKKLKPEKGNACCWHCVKCDAYQYLLDENTCRDCGKTRKPNSTQTGCVQLDVRYLRWDSAWAIFPVCFSTLGIAAAIFVITVFLRFQETPIIKACGRELSYMILSGILLVYSVTFLLVEKPSAAVCAIRRLGLGLGLTLCYAALLTKTNRIYRIFKLGKSTPKKPKYISPNSQVFICLGLVGVQMLGMIAWLIAQPPSSKVEWFRPRDPQFATGMLLCGTSDVSFISSLCYSMVLVVMSTIYAVKTRHIPDNFNETKHIGFAVYTTCIIWLAFIPIFFGTSQVVNKEEIQFMALSVSLSLSATVLLCCLFAPKLYIVLLHPEMNVRPRRVSKQEAMVQQAVAKWRKAVEAPDPNETAETLTTVLSSNEALVSTKDPNGHRVKWRSDLLDGAKDDYRGDAEGEEAAETEAAIKWRKPHGHLFRLDGHEDSQILLRSSSVGQVSPAKARWRKVAALALAKQRAGELGRSSSGNHLKEGVKINENQNQIFPPDGETKLTGQLSRSPYSRDNLPTRGILTNRNTNGKELENAGKHNSLRRGSLQPEDMRVKRNITSDKSSESVHSIGNKWRRGSMHVTTLEEKKEPVPEPAPQPKKPELLRKQSSLDDDSRVRRAKESFAGWRKKSLSEDSPIVNPIVKQIVNKNPAPKEKKESNVPDNLPAWAAAARWRKTASSSKLLAQRTAERPKKATPYPETSSTQTTGNRENSNILKKTDNPSNITNPTDIREGPFGFLQDKNSNYQNPVPIQPRVRNPHMPHNPHPSNPTTLGNKRSSKEIQDESPTSPKTELPGIALMAIARWKQAAEATRKAKEKAIGNVEGVLGNIFQSEEEEAAAQNSAVQNQRAAKRDKAFSNGGVSVKTKDTSVRVGIPASEHPPSHV
ncbi:GRM8 [Branchiostoma lanceolatum]|uniref:GRM8 protein n=1 Tax=Branchiostoma lanceolatum TaxID=7740 RepID=A0A8K0A2M0_BRALA|nr:GRM8 [Branchiostoma lanceolatum]